MQGSRDAGATKGRPCGYWIGENCLSRVDDLSGATHPDRAGLKSNRGQAIEARGENVVEVVSYFNRDRTTRISRGSTIADVLAVGDHRRNHADTKWINPQRRDLTDVG